MKDNFSSQSDQYARYRPTYPAEFFSYLNTLVRNTENAWDCGTGNGQVAFELAKTFDNVFATDISQEQIDNAIKANNISYSVQPAEKTDFAGRFFDLIVTAQAIHWFDFDKFYSEVRRTAKQNAVIGVVGYGKIEVSKPIDRIIGNFYENVIGAYWDEERRYIDEHYQTIPFPFEEIRTPEFTNRQQWTLKQLLGYLNTWSAVRHFIRQNRYNPVEELQNKIESQWGPGELREIHFPILLRAGKISS